MESASIKLWLTVIAFILFTGFLNAQDYFVAKTGDDGNPGTRNKPFQTISKAAEVAQPGSVITVHEGVYRERIDPPRGGISDNSRIIYQAARGEKVVIKGSEVIRGWSKLAGDAWMVTLPNSFFGDYNPYKVLIHGDWFDDFGRNHHTGAVYLDGMEMFEVPGIAQVLNPEPYRETDLQEQSTYSWYCETDESNTYIYANFQGADPNKHLVEINIRKACFYPERTGINYITVRGFHMSHAATQWAPPTAEQVGLIGTNWSKGWIIENNTISHSRCAGITLGKDRASGHNTWSEDPSVDGATHYNKLIDKVLREPYNWSKETIGSHIVRNNTIFNCEQAGICGSMGCAFSTITGNHIYNIWVKRQFRGAEIAGIKFHGAIDAVIGGNRIHNALKGIWLDWMTQGTRVTRNLVYDIASEDLFVEVNHGPFLVDNNLFLSNCVGILDGSSGGAYIHNIVKGKIIIVQQERSTPWMRPHSTSVYGLAITRNADNRYYNNVFLSVNDEINKTSWNPWWIGRGTYGLGVYDGYYPMYVDGNVYIDEAVPFPGEDNSLHLPTHEPGIRIEERGEHVYLHLQMAGQFADFKVPNIGSEMLGRVNTSDAVYEKADGTPFVLDIDYFGQPRQENTLPGPIHLLDEGTIELKIW